MELIQAEELKTIVMEVSGIPGLEYTVLNLLVEYEEELRVVWGHTFGWLP